MGLGQRGAQPGRWHLRPANLYGASPKVTQSITHTDWDPRLVGRRGGRAERWERLRVERERIF